MYMYIIRRASAPRSHERAMSSMFYASMLSMLSRFYVIDSAVYVLRAICRAFAPRSHIIQDSSKGGAVETGCSGSHHIIGCLLYSTTPIHCTPFPLHPPLLSIQHVCMYVSYDTTMHSTAGTLLAM